MQIVQTIYLVAMLSAVALGVISTNLLSAGIAHQHQTTKYMTLAMNGGVDDFKAYMAGYVRARGTQSGWPQQIAPSPAYPVCESTTTSCPYTYRVTATITGASGAGANGAAALAAANDDAINLQKFLIAEERISASVQVTLSDATGTVSSETRYVTMRVFEGSPYAMVSGQRDIQAANGDAGTIEGDTGGVQQRAAAFNSLAEYTPDPKHPYNYRDTTIVSHLSCDTIDNILNPSTNHPSHNQAAGNRGLPWGVGTDGGYELPCTDSFYVPPRGTFATESWNNGNVSAAKSQ